MLITMHRFFIHKGIVSAVMRAEFGTDGIMCVIRSARGNETIPSVHVLAEDKSGGTQDNFSEETEHVFYQFPNYQLHEVFIRKLIAKVRKEFFFFKCGNYSSHGTRSDRGF